MSEILGAWINVCVCNLFCLALHSLSFCLALIPCISPTLARRSAALPGMSFLLYNSIALYILK